MAKRDDVNQARRDEPTVVALLHLHAAVRDMLAGSKFLGAGKWYFERETFGNVIQAFNGVQTARGELRLHETKHDQDNDHQEEE